MLNIFLGHFWPEGASGGGGFSLFVTELLPTVQALHICICIKFSVKSSNIVEVYVIKGSVRISINPK